MISERKKNEQNYSHNNLFIWIAFDKNETYKKDRKNDLNSYEKMMIINTDVNTKQKLQIKTVNNEW